MPIAVVVVAAVSLSSFLSRLLPSHIPRGGSRIARKVALLEGEGSDDMRWYTDKHFETDDVLRHPADVEGWKHFDYEFPDFASNPWNVRLRLTSDGFIPFRQMSTSYNMWPVMEIDVYLQSLIEELKEL
ncbi:uncharacterized protein E5676_scaffold21G00770 [Cucumis melo var. makuwa]|uniref:Uncharacterized protein n=1 Tax=Cucumis melo var. makuwa TaxID=1194695 RepID=A0A5D3CXP4_CUCMM|nr:uncharacterized protein E5676_scaffold21G00770 [Cucumis melo var. makuwa]